MKTALEIVCILIAAGFAWLICAATFAPLGYEDATGFHDGKGSDHVD